MKSDSQKIPRVTYRDGSFWLDDQPVFIRAAEYQYYRDSVDNWPKRIEQIRKAGVNAITFYIPWRHHMPDLTMDQPDFGGTKKRNRDLPCFLSFLHDAGVLAIAKPGPFVHSELNIGGLPDWASPSFASDIVPMLRWDGAPLTWEYDRTILPAPYAEPFLTHSVNWLRSVGEILRPFLTPRGPVVAIQVNDETLYCGSNSPPWMMGYERSTLIAYHRENPEAPVDRWLNGGAPAESARWTDIAQNENRQEIENLVAWAHYQAWIRSDTYRLYRAALQIDLPYLTNYAGITPPIEENVPHRDTVTLHESTSPFTSLSSRYADWWFAHNPIEQSTDDSHYGFISWLGVTPYNIADPRTVDVHHPVVPNEVFSRYINTATRGRGINMEENWGFATLYHPYSGQPFVPIFQTLVSIAGGATGYVTFCVVSHDYWDETLDRTTKLQHPHFPSAAPIGPNGEERPMYTAMRDLNTWLSEHGTDLVSSTRHEDFCCAVYQPYSAITSWCDQWSDDERPPFQGYAGLESLSNCAQETGYVPSWIGVDGLDAIDPVDHPRLIAVMWKSMDPKTQQMLSTYIETGGHLFFVGTLPTEDWSGNPCTMIQAMSNRFPERVSKLAPDVTDPSTSPEKMREHLHSAGLRARITVPVGTRAFVYENNQGGKYLFFFSYDGRKNQKIEAEGVSLSIAAQGKCCGIFKIDGADLSAWYMKGLNEIEDTSALVKVTLAGYEHVFQGDCTSVLESRIPGPLASLHPK